LETKRLQIAIFGSRISTKLTKFRFRAVKRVNKRPQDIDSRGGIFVLYQTGFVQLQQKHPV
jgi:hypothetical protein